MAGVLMIILPKNSATALETGRKYNLEGESVKTIYPKFHITIQKIYPKIPLILVIKSFSFDY